MQVEAGIAAGVGDFLTTLNKRQKKQNKYSYWATFYPQNLTNKDISPQTIKNKVSYPY